MGVWPSFTGCSEYVCLLLRMSSDHPDDPQTKVLHVYDSKAMYDIFIKELDSYPEPVEYVNHTSAFAILERVFISFCPQGPPFNAWTRFVGHPW